MNWTFHCTGCAGSSSSRSPSLPSRCPGGSPLTSLPTSRCARGWSGLQPRSPGCVSPSFQTSPSTQTTSKKVISGDLEMQGPEMDKDSQINGWCVVKQTCIQLILDSSLQCERIVSLEERAMRVSTARKENNCYLKVVNVAEKLPVKSYKLQEAHNLAAQETRFYIAISLNPSNNIYPFFRLLPCKAPSAQK